MQPSGDEERHIASVVVRVATALGDAIDRNDVEAEVRRCFADWRDVPVRDFVPVLAERVVRERFLRA